MNTKRYRSRRALFEVEAVKLGLDNRDEIADWCGGVGVLEHDAAVHSLTYPAINVPCREEMKRAQFTHWVFKYPDGTFDTYNDLMFITLFEPID